MSPRSSIEGISYGIQPYNDLPAPSDFTFDSSDNSWAFRLFEESALNLRSGIFRYVGDRDVGQLVNWYITQMPEHKWVKTSDNSDREGRRTTLFFSKESEEAVIDITRENNSKRRNPYTVIEITLGMGLAGK